MESEKQHVIELIKPLIKSFNISKEDIYPEEVVSKEPFRFKILELIDTSFTTKFYLCKNNLYTSYKSFKTGSLSLQNLLDNGWNISKVETSHGIFSIGDVGIHMNNVEEKAGVITNFEMVLDVLFFKSKSWATNACYIQRAVQTNITPGSIHLFTPEQTKAIELIVKKETRTLKDAVRCLLSRYTSLRYENEEKIYYNLLKD